MRRSPEFLSAALLVTMSACAGRSQIVADPADTVDALALLAQGDYVDYGACQVLAPEQPVNSAPVAPPAKFTPLEPRMFVPPPFTKVGLLLKKDPGAQAAPARSRLCAVVVTESDPAHFAVTTTISPSLYEPDIAANIVNLKNQQFGAALRSGTAPHRPQVATFDCRIGTPVALRCESGGVAAKPQGLGL